MISTCLANIAVLRRELTAWALCSFCALVAFRFTTAVIRVQNGVAGDAVIVAVVPFGQEYQLALVAKYPLCLQNLEHRASRLRVLLLSHLIYESNIRPGYV